MNVTIGNRAVFENPEIKPLLNKKTNRNRNRNKIRNDNQSEKTQENNANDDDETSNYPTSSLEVNEVHIVNNEEKEIPSHKDNRDNKNKHSNQNIKNLKDAISKAPQQQNKIPQSPVRKMIM